MFYRKQLMKTVIFLILLTALFSLTIPKSHSAGALSISASLSKESYNVGEYIRINGVIKDEFNNPISGVSISIQVDGPSGVAHLALVYSNQDGTFTHEFMLPSNAEAGTYVIHLTASKQGYSDATTQISCLVVSEFNGLTAALFSLTLLLVLTIVFKRKTKLF